MKRTLKSALARYGSEAKAKLANVAATGEPEDQLRAPLEGLLAELCGFPAGTVAAVGESALAALKTRPDYAITLRNALIGFLEIKAPGKGADPRRFRGHDKEQWEKLHPLPNLLYTDGNQFSLWRSGQMEGAIITLNGDVETSGAALGAPAELLALFDDFFRWEPIPPGSARELAKVSARLCRLLRAEVAEQLALGSPALTALATDWRKLLFPEASDTQFADGYAQAVTFGLLMARAREIRLSAGLDQVAKQLGQANSLIGAALRLLTDDAENQATLKTSLGTLTRVLDAVNWHTISKGDPDAWLYFYEDFLEVYDNELRKQTGSYYTPPQVVGAMVRLVDEVLRGSRFGLAAGLAAPAVTVADPAAGTGTFLLGFLGKKYKAPVSVEDLLAYLAAVAAHPAYTARFQADLVKPGLRIPLTADGKLFAEAAELGRTVLWLHTFGERFADAGAGRPAQPPRLPRDQAPRIPADGTIPPEPDAMPDEIDYDAARKRLRVGGGYVENVPPAVWAYEVSGKHVLTQWFSYRKRDRERPLIGDRRPPSKLGAIQPDHWPAEYTTELLNVLHVLGRLVELEGPQAQLFDRICSGRTISADELLAAGALAVPPALRKLRRPDAAHLFDEGERPAE
jgi:hypothetical protein